MTLAVEARFDDVTARGLTSIIQNFLTNGVQCDRIISSMPLGQFLGEKAGSFGRITQVARTARISTRRQLWKPGENRAFGFCGIENCIDVMQGVIVMK
jgi:hypothetical protein